MVNIIVLEFLGFIDVIVIVITFGKKNPGLAKSFLEYIEKNREY